MRYFLCLLPPVAVLSTGRLGSFLLSIPLTLIGWVPGMIYAVVVVADFKANQRTNRVIKVKPAWWA